MKEACPGTLTSKNLWRICKSSNKVLNSKKLNRKHKKSRKRWNKKFRLQRNRQKQKRWTNKFLLQRSSSQSKQMQLKMLKMRVTTNIRKRISKKQYNFIKKQLTWNQLSLFIIITRLLHLLNLEGMRKLTNSLTKQIKYLMMEIRIMWRRRKF